MAKMPDLKGTISIEFYPQPEDKLTEQQRADLIAEARRLELDTAFPKTILINPLPVEVGDDGEYRFTGKAEPFVPRVGAVVEWHNGQADQAPVLGTIQSFTDEASLVALQSGFTMRIMNTHLKDFQ